LAGVEILNGMEMVSMSSLMKKPQNEVQRLQQEKVKTEAREQT
jgi:hypothetical protein